MLLSGNRRTATDPVLVEFANKNCTPCMMAINFSQPTSARPKTRHRVPCIYAQLRALWLPTVSTVASVDVNSGPQEQCSPEATLRF
jgi:hypothetical protein